MYHHSATAFLSFAQLNAKSSIVILVPTHSTSLLIAFLIVLGHHLAELSPSCLFM